jgi:Phage integrase, N-terminal SAM-like domain
MKVRQIGIKKVTLKQHGYQYDVWEVHGYKADGTRIRIRCKDEATARIRKSEQEAAAINAARSTRFVQTRLSDEQLNEAEACFARLQPKYTLTGATDYFLRHFRAPDFEIAIGDAVTRFLAAQEGTIRPRTMRWIKGALEAFSGHANGASVHEVTPSNAEEFMQSLRAKDGVNKASKKTWNNTRQVLSQFFGWCVEQKFTGENPAAGIKMFKIDSGHIDVLPVERCRELMEHVAQHEGGKLVLK